VVETGESYFDDSTGTSSYLRSFFQANITATFGVKAIYVHRVSLFGNLSIYKDKLSGSTAVIIPKYINAYIFSNGYQKLTQAYRIKETLHCTHYGRQTYTKRGAFATSLSEQRLIHTYHAIPIPRPCLSTAMP
jgi:hypothetical protein